MNKIKSTVVGFELPNGDFESDHFNTELKDKLVELYPEDLEVIDCRIKLCNSDTMTLFVSIVLKYDVDSMTHSRLERYIETFRNGVKELLEGYFNENSIPYTNM